ncbi:MAG: cyclic nucleotide-binding domain-containing protein [Bacteroidia bacterium]|nr:cyclic nucleotide-binding domain-containing protein [Bacteroidia bacterium]MDW8345943.1 cyclic nucleotide-binding domain-containing protein [Bacteroidia bacterium]
MLKDLIKNPFKKRYSEEDERFIEFFRRVILFSTLEDSEILEFKPYIYERTYQPDEVVFHQGDPSKAMFFIKSGKVQIRMQIGQYSRRLVTLTEGHAFGENCLVEDKPHPVSAIVMESSCLYVLAQTDIQKVFEEDKDIPGKMLAKFGELYYEWTLKVIFKLLSKNVPIQEGILDLRVKNRPYPTTITPMPPQERR